MSSTQRPVLSGVNSTDPTRNFLKQVKSVESELLSLQIELAKVRELVATRRLYISPGSTPLGGSVRDSIVQLAHGLAALQGKLYAILSSSSF
jgi:hypothetical protein